MTRTPSPALAVALVLAAWGCAGPGGPGAAGAPQPPYQPDRRDYIAFRTAHPDLLEPNYLPFMVHRISQPEGEGDALVLCRWPSKAMPLAVYIGTPSIPPGLQDEFEPKDPERYVEAVERALDAWERELEGLVRFRRVANRRRARLEVILVGERGPEPDPDRQGLGRIHLAGACHARGWDPGADRFEVSFEVAELRVYLADRFGLLQPDQVEWVALHEIGHALGMSGHSPIPADLMYEVARDRVSVPGLSTEDVNSFVSLYQLPNGTVFARVPPESADDRPPPQPPSGPPELAMAPYVDPILGFALHPPKGWTLVAMSQGMVAVDGVTWDYDASFQVIVQRYPTIEAYVERFGAHYLSHGWLLHNAFVVINGRRSLQAVIEDFAHRFIEEITLIETGDGRVIVVIADCPVDAASAYSPWFRAALASLEIWSDPQPRRPIGPGEGGGAQ